MMKEPALRFFLFLVGAFLATAIWSIILANAYPNWESKADLIIRWDGKLYRMVPAEKVYR